jgi:hypothetical protein
MAAVSTKGTKPSKVNRKLWLAQVKSVEQQTKNCLSSGCCGLRGSSTRQRVSILLQDHAIFRGISDATDVLNKQLLKRGIFHSDKRDGRYKT